MLININRSSDTPIYLQLRNQIRDMIISEKLPANYMLPPERELCKQLNVNRTTVVKAYQELKADGLVEAHVGRGTVVLARPFTGCCNNIRQFNELPWYQLFNENFNTGSSHIMGDMMDISCKEGIISFSGGFPSPEFLPMDAIGQLQGSISKNYGRELFLHSPVEGYRPLRENIARLMKSRQMPVYPKEIMILSGSQQGLDYLSRIFIKHGDMVVVEEPSFFGAINIFRSAGAKVIGVPVDHNGMMTDILESVIQRYKPKFIYTIPTFQNPSGVSMSLERRHELLNLSYKYQIPVIEDDPYGDLRYDGEAVPSLKALDPYGHVIYLSTFSKVLSFGLRIGWVAAPQQVIDKFAHFKQMTDMHVNTASQILLSEFLAQGFYEQHITLVRREYGLKRDAMHKALKKHCIPGVSWDKPEGGFYFWCRLPEYVTNNRLFSKAAEKQVIYLQGEAFYPEGTQGENFIRLNFTFTDTQKIDEGIKRLMEALNEVMTENGCIAKDTFTFRNPIV